MDAYGDYMPSHDLPRVGVGGAGSYAQSVRRSSHYETFTTRTLLFLGTRVGRLWQPYPRSGDVSGDHDSVQRFVARLDIVPRDAKVGRMVDSTHLHGHLARVVPTIMQKNRNEYRRMS